MAYNVEYPLTHKIKEALSRQGGHKCSLLFCSARTTSSSALTIATVLSGYNQGEPGMLGETVSRT